MSRRILLAIVVGLLMLAFWSTTVVQADNAVRQDTRATATPAASGGGAGTDRLPPSGTGGDTSATPNRLPPSGGAFDPSSVLLVMGAGSALVATGLAMRGRRRRDD